MAEKSKKAHRPYPAWFYAVNMLALICFLAVLVAYGVLSQFIVNDVPYDYGLLMFGGEQFCYAPENFSYDGFYLYPAPFYTTFCTVFHFVPGVLFWLWMLLPFLIVAILSGQRAVAYVYPPFYVHMLLGQSTWLLLPLYWLGLLASDNGRVRWWYGFFVPLAIFKPHIAILPLAWLLWIGRRHTGFMLVTAISSVIVTIPAFLLRPNWLLDWLVAGRSFKLPSIANIGIFPIQWLQLGEEMTPLVSSGVGLLLTLAWGGLIALTLLWLIRRRRGTLEFYDWVLVFAFTNPFVHDYDLILLLPFIANRPKRLLLAITAGLLAWTFAMQTGNYNASVVIPLVLLTARLWRLDTKFDAKRAAIRW